MAERECDYIGRAGIPGVAGRLGVLANQFFLKRAVFFSRVSAIFWGVFFSSFGGVFVLFGGVFVVVLFGCFFFFCFSRVGAICLGGLIF